MVARVNWNRLSLELGKFRSARGGNVAIIFALAMIPICAALGAAVDYSRANSARSAMQSALDSTALMVAKEAKSLTSAEIQTRAEAIFKAMYNRPEAYNIKIQTTYNSETGVVDLSAAGTLKTTVANVVGVHQMDISTNTRVATAGSDLEIVLVLDNTGSMSWSGKMEALKAASKMFVNELKKTSKKPDRKSVV